jgi:methionyl-tRNA formyltransferase
MKKLKIGYFADGPWSHNALHKLISDESLEIMFVVPRFNSTDTTLRDICKEYNIEFLPGVRICEKEFFERCRLYDCDLFVSMSFNQIFKKELIQLPRYKTINCHAGKLPFYRGRNVLNWALINDESEFGITVHYVDEGIDTGDIILQKTFPITDNDNYSTLLRLSYIECAKILYESIKLIQFDQAKPIVQTNIHPTGFYCGRRLPGDEFINWHQSSRDIFNFIRAICDPGPIATTRLGSELVKINSARLINNIPSYKGKCGQILGKTKDGFIVKTSNTFLEIFDIVTLAELKVGNTFL